MLVNCKARTSRMTVIQYNILPSFKQLALVWSKGVFIAKRFESDFLVMLYQIQSFYVEVYYSRFDNDVEKIYPFNNTDQLEPYLDKLDLEHDLK